MFDFFLPFKFKCDVMKIDLCSLYTENIIIELKL